MIRHLILGVSVVLPAVSLPALAEGEVRTAAQVTVVEQPLVVVRPEDEALRAQLLKKDVLIEITYWGEPVKDATVYLRGKGFDLKYDRGLEATDKLLRDQRLTGIYVF